MSTAAAGPFAARRALHRAVRRRRPVPARQRTDGASRAGAPRLPRPARRRPGRAVPLPGVSARGAAHHARRRRRRSTSGSSSTPGSGGLADAVAAVSRDDHDPVLFRSTGSRSRCAPSTDLGTAARRLVAAILADDLEPGMADLRRGADRAERPGRARRAGRVRRARQAPHRRHRRRPRTPSEDEVADVHRSAASTARSRFKCTAGLHHAVRNTDPDTGFEQHGFLNILLAVSRRARRRRPRRSVAAELADRDADGVADRVRAPDAGAGAADPAVVPVVRHLQHRGADRRPVALGSPGPDRPMEALA